ncbi:S1 family peptidase [Planctomicrobium sp. SH668]|uniref:S1 family peptidase n=1 Tax=Planctomicrobium sp. SH668 TaxID=3448126 RepID=UPI003F5B448F
MLQLKTLGLKRCLSLIAAVLTLGFYAELRADDFGNRILAATYKLFNPTSTATCILVKRDESDPAVYVVTAQHVLEKANGDVAQLVLRREEDGQSYVRVDHPVTIRKDMQPLWTKHPQQDVASLKVTEPFPFPIEPLLLSDLADQVRLNEANPQVCDQLYLLSFPQRFEGNHVGFPVARAGIFSTPPLLDSDEFPTFIADYTTFAGDSGGPAFIKLEDGRPLVVGLAIGQIWHGERFGSETMETNLRHAMGLGIVLHSRFLIEVIEQSATQPVPSTEGVMKQEATVER